MESNKLIAEFMGKEIYQKYHESYYHTSWDWLMPVVHKIKESDLDFDVLEIGLPIEDVYKAVVEFIKEKERLNMEYESFNDAPYGQDTEDEASDMLYGVDNNQ
jgi:hypothetical protein